MKSETSFRGFFLKQHRKNSLKNIFFPSGSVFLDFSFWPQGHRSTQNAHCALGHPKQFLESIVCSLGYFNRDIFTSRSQIADYLWGQTFCPIKYYIYKEFLYILVSIQPFMFHNHFNNTMPIWVQYSTGVLMSHYHKLAVSVSFLARFCSNVYSIWWMWRVEGILPLLSTTKMHLLFSTGNCTLFHLLRSPFKTS